jgi:hypothetical protein
MFLDPRVSTYIIPLDATTHQIEDERDLFPNGKGYLNYCLGYNLTYDWDGSSLPY